MHVWKHRLGIIVPSWNTAMEYELQQLASATMSVHSVRIAHTADTEENLVRMSTEVPGAAGLLSHAKVDVICYGCTAGGFLKSPEEDRELAAKIFDATGIPGVTSSSAVVDALRELGVTRVSVASPYEAWLNARLKSYLEADGFCVVAILGLGTQAHAGVTSDRIAALAQEVVRPETEAVFISCSNLRTLQLIQPLERALGKPVVTSNASSMWKMLRLLGDRQTSANAGLLFDRA